MNGVVPQGWLARPEHEGACYKVVADGELFYEGHDSWEVWRTYWRLAYRGVMRLRKRVGAFPKTARRRYGEALLTVFTVATDAGPSPPLY